MSELKRPEDLANATVTVQWVNTPCSECGFKYEVLHRSKVCDTCREPKAEYDARVRRHLGIDKGESK